MESYLAFLFMREGGQMSRRLFKTEIECRNWVAEQSVPSWAFGWWLEAFAEDGSIAWSKAVDK